MFIIFTDKKILTGHINISDFFTIEVCYMPIIHVCNNRFYYRIFCFNIFKFKIFLMFVKSEFYECT